MNEQAKHSSEREIQDRAAHIEAAARTLIGMTRGIERIEHARSTHAELTLEVALPGGGMETWKITIERTASSH